MVPMIPLTTLRTAQLFQMSCPRISSIVGRRKGSIFVSKSSFAAGTEEEEEEEESAWDAIGVQSTNGA